MANFKRIRAGGGGGGGSIKYYVPSDYKSM